MMTSLGALADVSTGYPFRTKVNSEEGGDIVLVQIRDLDSVSGAPGTDATVLRSDGSKYERYLLRAGDLLFQSRGSRHPVAVVDFGFRGIAATGLHVLRPDTQQVLPEFLAWWLNHPMSQAKFKNDIARGTYIPFVSKRDLEEFVVPLPPTDVQLQIIEVDRLRRQERKLRERLDILTQQLVDGATLVAATRK